MWCFSFIVFWGFFSLSVESMGVCNPGSQLGVLKTELSVFLHCKQKPLTMCPPGQGQTMEHNVSFQSVLDDARASLFTRVLCVSFKSPLDSFSFLSSMMLFSFPSTPADPMAWTRQMQCCTSSSLWENSNNNNKNSLNLHQRKHPPGWGRAVQEQPSSDGTGRREKALTDAGRSWSLLGVTLDTSCSHLLGFLCPLRAFEGGRKIPERGRSLADVVFLLFLRTHFNSALGCSMCSELSSPVPPLLRERIGFGVFLFSVQHFSSTVSVIQHKSLPA